MNTDKINQYAHDVLEAAWQMRHEGDVMPVWHVVGGNQEQIIVSPFDSYEAKRAVALFVADTVRETKATTVIFVHDAWMRKVEGIKDLSEEEAQALIHAGPPPSEHPDRVECIVVAIWNADGTTQMLEREYGQDCAGALVIHRDSDKGIITTETFAEVLDALKENA